MAWLWRLILNMLNGFSWWWGGPRPIAFVSVASATAAFGGTSITVNVPAGVASGDVMVAAIYANDGGSLPTITAPAGWDLVRSDTVGVTRLSTYTRAVSGEPANYQWTTDVASAFCGAIAAYKNVSTVTPVNTHGGQAAAGPTGDAVAPTITPTAAGTMLVGAFGSNQASVTWTPAGGMTERADVAVATATMELADESWANAEATGTRTAVCSAALGNTIGQVIALK